MNTALAYIDKSNAFTAIDHWRLSFQVPSTWNKLPPTVSDILLHRLSGPFLDFSSSSNSSRLLVVFGFILVCEDFGRMFDYSFPDSASVSGLVPTLCLNTGIVSPLRLRWVKSVCVFRCNLPPALWHNDRGLLRATVVTRGEERTWNKSQDTKLTLENKTF